MVLLLHKQVTNNTVVFSIEHVGNQTSQQVFFDVFIQFEGLIPF